MEAGHDEARTRQEHEDATDAKADMDATYARDATAPEQPIAATMRAVRLLAAGGPEALSLDDVPTPAPGAGEVLVRVHAAAITRDELEWPVDRLPAIPSYELSGVVAAVGPGGNGSGVGPGDAVFGLTRFDRDGAAAGYVAVPAELVAPKPAALDHVEAAALPLSGLSAWQGLFDHGRLESGERVLIHGAAGGVGHLATRLARLRGAHVVATVAARSLGDAERLGADEVYDAARVRLEELEAVDLVFDTAGGALLAGSAAALRPGGRLVSVAEEPPAEAAASAGIEATYFVVEPSREQLVELARLAEAGDLRPEIDSVFPLADAREAFERSMARGKRGKVVLRVADE